MTTSEPERCSTIARRRPAASSSTPVVLTASTCSQVASSSSSTGTLQPTPAFAQAMSTRPCARSTAARAACRLAARGDVVPHGERVVALAAQPSRRAPRPAAASRSPATTRAPCSQSLRAIAAPIDPAAPETYATFPSSSISVPDYRRERAHRIREDLGRPRPRQRPALRRPAPRPRGHEPAGVRGPAARRAHACGGPIARSRRPTTTCPRGISRARSRTRSRGSSSTRSRATSRSSASRTTGSATAARASST